MTADASMYVPDPVFISNDSNIFSLDTASSSKQDTPTSGSTSTYQNTPATSSNSKSPDATPFKSMLLHSSNLRQPRTLAPNLTRRSHKKSRAGCFTCKSRKIKCGEQKPKCGNCLLKGLSCVYPTITHPKKHPLPLPLAKRSPSSLAPGASSFTITDMRFFHHFLTTAYPHLPLGNDHIWVNEIPSFAEHHEYLMHAILSLGASHLSRLTGVDYRRESLVHRGLAISGLNTALSRHAKSYGEADSMLATCYALTFQASYMGDGLADFITMVRGCALTTGKIVDEEAPTAFNLEADWHYKIMAPRLENMPCVNPILLEDGVESLAEVRPYLASDVNHDFHEALLGVLTGLMGSSSEGYVDFIGVYGVWYELCHDSFKSFLDPNNMVAQLLLAYFTAIQMLMVPLAAYEWPERANSSQIKVLYGTVEWADGLFEKLEKSELSQFLRWPKRIVRTVVRELGGELVDGPRVLRLDLPVNMDGSPEEGMSVDVDIGFDVGLWAEGRSEGLSDLGMEMGV